jgi:uncharacterized membrane protein
VAGLTALVAAMYAALALTLQYTVRTSSYDLVIFDQAIRSYSHLHAGLSIIKGYHNGFGPHFSELGDHFSPIIALVAPFYWIYNGPQTMLVAQALLFALAIPPLWLYTRRALGGGRMAVVAAYCIAIAYGLSWPLVMAGSFDFHEVAFAPVLMAVIFERLQAGKPRTALLAIGGLLLVKEDMGFFVMGIGVFLIVQDLLLRKGTIRRQWLLGVSLIVGGLIVAVVAVYVLIPALGGRSNYYWAYDNLGPNGPAAVKFIIEHPLRTLHILVSPSEKVHTYLWLLAPFLFLSLLSPAVIPVIPLLLERMLGITFPAWWGLGAQYNTYLVVALTVAAVDGAATVDRWARKIRMGKLRVSRLKTNAVAVTCTALMAALAIAIVPRWSLGQIFEPSFYHRTATEAYAAEAAAAVPNGITVAAMSNVGPQLTSRDTVLMWDGDGSTPPFQPWVVCSETIGTFTFKSLQEQVNHVNQLKAHGYVTVFNKGGYLVMHAPGVKDGGKG